MSITQASQSDTYDLIAIGSGPAGESATELAAYFGHRCLIIEKDKPGGTVTTTGGVPTKTLREAALYYTGFRERDIYGIRMTSRPELMLDAVRERTWKVSETLQKLTGEKIASSGVDYIRAKARLGADQIVLVETSDGHERAFRGKTILIASGSRPARPKLDLPPEHPGICDTDSIMRRGQAPRHLLIVGGGPVAVEFATIALALGSEVTLVNKSDRLLAMMDGEISQRMTAQMASCGVRIVAEATLQTVTADGEWLDVTLTNSDGLRVDTIMFAAGRVGNSEKLGLKAAGVETDAKGRIIVDAQFRTSANGIYAAGDVIAPTLASLAMEQGRRAVCHAMGIPLNTVIDPVPVSAVYGVPELARAGMTEEECFERGLDYEVGRSELEETPRGAIAGHGGLLKLLFLRESRKIVGVHCIGDIASEMIGIGQMAIRCGETIHSFANMTLNTPTYSYAYKYAAFDGLRRLPRESLLSTPSHAMNANPHPNKGERHVHF